MLLNCPTAFATTPPRTPDRLPTAESTQADARHPYCSREVQYTESLAQPIHLACYSTRAKAYSVATGDPSYLTLTDAQIRQLDGTVTGQTAPDGVAPASICGNCSGRILLGTDYWDTHYGGSLVYWWSNSDCTTLGGSFATGLLAGWNDKISSAAINPNSHCGNWIHYADAYAGKTIDCGWASTRGAYHTCYDMYLPDGSSMSDRTSTERFYFHP
ncbi:MAG TPA: hypothetical protein VJ831_15510 [Jatrophihabitantaceae bacterium]|nr:hypothetical protein [Jatrophihabitantaceae bacterium]